MNKKILALCAIAASICGCNNEIDIFANNFTALCEMSGGSVMAGEGKELTCLCSNIACKSGVVCINSGSLCADSVELASGEHCDKEGATQCSSGYYIECQKTVTGELAWSGELRCENGNSCKDSVECGECVNETVICDENSNQKTCVDGLWNVRKCPIACGLSEDGLSFQCVGEDERCQSDSCSNGKLMACVNEFYKSLDPCPSGNSCKSDTECGACVNGATQCVQDKESEVGHVQVCQNGLWVEDGSCEDDVSCRTVDGHDVCGECHNSKIPAMCLADDRGFSYDYICKNGEWVKRSACLRDGLPTSCHWEYSKDEAGDDLPAVVLCGDCLNGKETKCEDDKSGAGAMWSCFNGAWSSDPKDRCEQGFSCNQNKTACGECVNGDVKCVDQKNGKLVTGLRYVCVNGFWEQDATTPECREGSVATSCTALGKSCGVCVNGDVKCENDAENKAQYSTCVNGAWVAQACANHNASCEETNGCGLCTNGEMRCESDTRSGTGVLKECKNGLWTQVTCYDEENGRSVVSCVSSEDKPDHCGVCRNGDYRCIDNNNVGYRERCENGAWKADEPLECANHYSCLSDGVSCSSECQNGAMKCDDDELGWGHRYVCKAGRWVYDDDCMTGDAHPTSCNEAKTACGECRNTLDNKCVNNGNVGESWDCQYGKFVKKSDCGNNVSCNEAGTECGACRNDTDKCIEDNDGVNAISRRYHCSNGQWSVTEICSSKSGDSFTLTACMPGSSDCAECKIGETRCVSKEASDDGEIIIQQCVNGLWSEAKTCQTYRGKTCESLALAEKQCEPECTEAINTCENDSLVGKRIRCENGVRVDTPCLISNEQGAYMKVSCSDKECGNCIDGTTRCTDGEGNEAFTERCIRGQWSRDNKCLNAQGESVSCAASGQSCGVCQNDDVKCENDDQTHVAVISNCVMGEWVRQNTTNSFSCRDDAVGECLNESIRCIEEADGQGKIEVCANGNWDVRHSQACANGASCRSDGQSCGECNHVAQGEKTCENDAATGVGGISQCLNGVLLHETCPANESCDADKKSCGQCIEGTTVCSDNAEKRGSIKTCVGGQYKEDVPCTVSNNGHDAASCHVDHATCGECVNGAVDCRESKQMPGRYAIQSCEFGRWVEKSICSHYGCKLDSPECAECDQDLISTCVDNETGVGKMTKCVNGVIEEVIRDGDDAVSCNEAHTALGECRNGDVKCINDKNMNGTIYSCVFGKWEKDEACANQASCLPDGSWCADCHEGKYFCENTETLFQHSLTLNSLISEYEPDMVMNGGVSGRLTRVCENGQWRNLTNAEIQICALGDDNVPVSCLADGSDCGECVNGWKRCFKGEKDVMKVCQDAHYIEVETEQCIGACKSQAFPSGTLQNYPPTQNNPNITIWWCE